MEPWVAGFDHWSPCNPSFDGLCNGGVHKSPQQKRALHIVFLQATEHAIHGDPDGLGARALFHLASGRNIHQAVKDLRRARFRQPHRYEPALDLSAALFLLYKASENINYLIESIDLSSRATKDFPYRPEAYFNKALALSELGLLQESLADFRQTLKMLPQDSPWNSEVANRISLLGRRLSSENQLLDQFAQLEASITNESSETTRPLVRRFPLESLAVYRAHQGREIPNSSHHP